jgi:hypothetical protein
MRPAKSPLALSAPLERINATLFTMRDFQLTVHTHLIAPFSPRVTIEGGVNAV